MNGAAATPRLPLRSAVIGAGPMGISLAAMLGRSVPVSMVVRNTEAAGLIERLGVRVVGLLEASASPRVVPSITALVNAAPFDVVFVATKTTAIDAVAEELRPVLPDLGAERGPPHIVSFQNGIEPGRALMERLEHAGVLRMVLNYGATRRDHRTAEVMLSSGPHYLGAPHCERSSFASDLARALTECGLETCATDQIESHVWEKGVLNAAMNPVAALTDSSVGGVLDSPARAIVARLMQEGLTVAAAEGVDLGRDPGERMWEVLEAARAHTPSMVGDIRGGRPSEIGQLNRQVVEHAGRVGVAAPTHEVIVSLIDAFDWRVFHLRGAARGPGAAVRPGGPFARSILEGLA